MNGQTAEAPTVTVRQASPDDYDDVVAFTSDTWADREGTGDYIPYVYEEWMETEGPTQRTFVADDAGTAVGICQAVVLSEHEGWMQAMRVHPEYRGAGVSTKLNDAGFQWLYDRGCAVARNMVFSWNVGGLGGSRAAGFDPCTEFRWAEPAPDAGATPELDVGDDPDAAWAFWQASDARTHLRGLALDAEESWALSELTRDRLRNAAAEGRLFTVGDGGIRGFSFRNRVYDRESDDEAGEGDGRETETWVEYAVGAWADSEACDALLAAIARDADGVDADRTRVLIPESVQWVSDVAAARCPVADEPDFVLAADLTDPSVRSH